MKRIHDSLQRIFQRHRLVFWYDATGEWAETFTAYPDADVAKLTVAGNEFGTKVRIVRDPNPEARFLIYVPTARPPDADNWLLDLLLQGYEYKADKASLALQDVGLPHEFFQLAEDHAPYFASGKRVQALKELIGKDDQSRDVRLKMMAVLAGTAVEIDALLLHFLKANPEDALIEIDPVNECLQSSALEAPFWKEVTRLFGYTATAPALRDFAVSLFRGANPLDDQVALHPHAKVFLQRWKDSQAYSVSFREWSRHMERELQIETALGGWDERKSLGDWDTFEVFEKFTLLRLCQSFTKGGLGRRPPCGGAAAPRLVLAPAARPRLRRAGASRGAAGIAGVGRTDGGFGSRRGQPLRGELVAHRPGVSPLHVEPAPLRPSAGDGANHAVGGKILRE